tara:strand:- start:223 stop:678 length:456 start_codon:yes stop_codon:yes gene_type:complete
MIQRIQSLYLLVAIVLQSLSLVLNWSTYLLEDSYYTLTGLSSSFEAINAMPLVFGITVSIILLIVVLLQYKNRARQMQLANIAIIQLLLVMGLFSWIHYNLINSIKADFPEMEIGYGVAVIFPLVSILLVWMAKKAVKKDDDLVRSADRLR